MGRYIDADRIDMNQVTVYDYKEQKWTHIFDIPEDIVRCKNCKHREVQVDGVFRYELCGIRNEIINLEGFCHMGERREDAETD